MPANAFYKCDRVHPIFESRVCSAERSRSHAAVNSANQTRAFNLRRYFAQSALCCREIPHPTVASIPHSHFTPVKVINLILKAITSYFRDARPFHPLVAPQMAKTAKITF